jgi:glycosyltransferase involved in cell wall biosynthesis
MDLYPEVAVLSGLLRPGLIVNLLRSLDAGNCRQASAVVVLSEDMKATLGDRGLDTHKVLVLNNFEIDDDATCPGSPPISKSTSSFRILFAGNMGNFQGLEQIIDAADELRDDAVFEFVFMGAGTRVSELKSQAGDLLGKSVRFLDQQPLSTALQVMKDSDLAVVSLRPGIHRVAFPSKTMMYLKAGCRLLAIVEPDSELARMVWAERLGTVVPPGDKAALVAAIRSELLVRGGGERRSRIIEVGGRYFGRSTTLARWSQVIAELAKEVPRA